jgi:hypothetical protein
MVKDPIAVNQLGNYWNIGMLEYWVNGLQRSERSKEI